MPKQNTGSKYPTKQRTRYGSANSRVSKADRIHKLDLEFQRREQLLANIADIQERLNRIESFLGPGLQSVPEGKKDLSDSSSEVQNGE